MYMYDRRMLEGDPLCYYTPGYSPNFTYFHRFDAYGNGQDMSEEFMTPSSPNSVQSDSDNSISSSEIWTKTGDDGIVRSKTQCGWRSCGIVFDSLDELASHVGMVHASSGPGGLFYCGWEGCSRNDRGFNARYKMLVHVRTHTNEKPHKCNQCDKSFSRAENLKIHSRSHSGEKPYACPVPGCFKAYSNSSDRFKHTRTHQVDKPYRCKVPGCPKRYTDPSSLRKHVKTYKHLVNESKTKEMPKNGCTRPCCAATPIQSNDLLNIALINIKPKENFEKVRWDSMLEPVLFKPYETQENMQIDCPLDLRINRTHVAN